MTDFSPTTSLPEISLETLLWNFLLCVVLSFILCWHFNARAKKRFLRRDLGLVLPVICLTTLLVISVVKSSLALSLGLVGALSIVRFRTPIKEPGRTRLHIFVDCGWLITGRRPKGSCSHLGCNHFGGDLPD